MNNFIGSAYNKESIEEFIKNNSNLYKIKLSDIYILLVKSFSCAISGRRIRLKINTTNHVSFIFRKNGHNFNAAFLSIILNMHNDNFINNIDYIINSGKTREINSIVHKYISLDVFRSVYQFLPDNSKDLIINNIGTIFDYYYVINR